MRYLVLSLVLLMISGRLTGQDMSRSFNGFVRGAVYLSTGSYSNDINAAFADVSLQADITNHSSFRSFADIRGRAGQQFAENADYLTVREAWCSYFTSLFEVSAGKKIIKWGKTDFFTPLSKFNPVDYSFRSPEREDADRGLITGALSFTPVSYLRLSFVAAPLWNPSILMTRPMKLPDNITLLLPEGYFTGNGYSSYGARADFTLRGIDLGIQWFHGADPMPGLMLDSADFADLMNPHVYMSGVPYNINSVGADFEAPLSEVVIRGSLSYMKPLLCKEGNEHVPFPQVEWVAGMDYTPGNFHITVEYSGKKVLDYYKSPYDPLIGSEPDMVELAALFMTPGFDPVEYSRLQTEASNRLYNYQLKESYHSAGARVEYEAFYGRLIPSLTAMYNFTGGDLALFPTIEYKPADNLSITAGAEYYSGRKGGLFSIIDDFMNAVFVSVRTDF